MRVRRVMMTRRIPDEVVEQIRNSVDIVDVISEYVQLKKQGRNYFGLCPFHGESTPSFSVSPEKQIYHCFGCGAGGNAISFLMNIEGVSFFDAVKKLSTNTNVSVNEYEVSEVEENVSSETEVMIAAHAYMTKYYHHLLMNTEEGKAALQYLLNRGFTEEIIAEFQIGYSLDNWDMAKRILQKRGFNLTLMEKAGLLGTREQDGSYFDRFRNRIMFPIHNLQGKVVGFSGRTLGDDTPKYMNTPETTIFSKGRLLYHYHLGRIHMRKAGRAILLEGYADVIAAQKAGFQETVATMGTALTEEQAKIIRRTVDDVIICYDGDKAGMSAALKAADILIKIGCQVKIAAVPDGLDPDEYVSKFGEEKFRTHVIESSLSITAFKLQYLRQGKNLQDEAEKITYLQQVLAEVAKLTKPLEIDYYLQRLSKDFSISLDVLKQELSQLQNKQPTNSQTNPVQQARQAPKQVQKRIRTAYENAERYLIAYMLQNSDVATVVQENLSGLFHIQEYSEIIVHLYAYYEEGNHPDISNFIHRLPVTLQNIVSEIALIPISPEVTDKEIQDCIKVIKRFEIEQNVKLKLEEQIQAQRNQDIAQVVTLQREINELRLQMKS